MESVYYGAAAAVLFLVGVLSVRMLRTTGLEDIDLPESREAEIERKDLGARMEAVGGRFLGMTLRLYGPDRLKALDQRIRAAGRPHGLTVLIYLRRQTGFVVMGIVFFVVLFVLDQPLIGMLVLLVHAAWMPWWLVATVKARRTQVSRDLPDFLDVLAVTIAAGLGFRQSMERVAAFHAGPIAEEVRTALQEMGMGVSRRNALIAMRDRVASPGMSAFVTALLQAEELGVSLGTAVTDIAEDVRRERAQEVRQTAAKAGTKVSLVVTTLIVPGSMILIFAGMFIGNDSLGGLF